MGLLTAFIKIHFEAGAEGGRFELPVTLRRQALSKRSH